MMVKPVIKVFKSSQTMSLFIAGEFIRMVNSAASETRTIVVALSGGSTPENMFRNLSKLSGREQVPWEAVHFFWGDERCVPPDYPDSNYGVARDLLLNNIPIPKGNIHRIRGEAEPFQEKDRYAQEIRQFVPLSSEGIPQFHWIFLGLGVDGHTASIFPGTDTIHVRNQFCAAAVHPETGQNRITLTLPVLNNANRVSFLISGEAKRAIVERILRDPEAENKYPAAMVQPQNAQLEWFIDRQAAVNLPM
ncbi:MAG: 6-phosphogluconolactonase [Calditrichaeota bacterium]|nr:6-phosphogluconolactonase [Calditrichota bacterium]RQW03953.1 MAG: 6-phosphogluconolactonase [Calditrichota bacterium]